MSSRTRQRRGGNKLRRAIEFVKEHSLHDLIVGVVGEDQYDALVAASDDEAKDQIAKTISWFKDHLGEHPPDVEAGFERLNSDDELAEAAAYLLRTVGGATYIAGFAAGAHFDLEQQVAARKRRAERGPGRRPSGRG